MKNKLWKLLKKSLNPLLCIKISGLPSKKCVIRYHNTRERWLRQGKRQVCEKRKSNIPKLPHYDFCNPSLASSEYDSSDPMNSQTFRRHFPHLTVDCDYLVGMKMQRAHVSQLSPFCWDICCLGCHIVSLITRTY